MVVASLRCNDGIIKSIAGAIAEGIVSKFEERRRRLTPKEIGRGSTRTGVGVRRGHDYIAARYFKTSSLRDCVCQIGKTVQRIKYRVMCR
mgnify:CR=1 FL=1